MQIFSGALLVKSQSKVQSKWLVSDALWAELEPLLPKHRKKSARGRPRVSDREAMNGIFFVLKTGMCRRQGSDHLQGYMAGG